MTDTPQTNKPTQQSSTKTSSPVSRQNANPLPSPNTRNAWFADFNHRATEYWTSARIKKVFGKKHLILPPNTCGPLLRAMSLMKRDASMSPQSIHKYMQISHMVTLLEPLLLDLINKHTDNGLPPSQKNPTPKIPIKKTPVSSHPRTPDRGAGSAVGLDARRRDAGIAALFQGVATQQTGLPRPNSPTGGVLGWEPVRLLDLGCGNSYLTLLLGWCFEHRWHYPAQILGVDLRNDVIQASQKRVGMVEVDELVNFWVGKIDNLDISVTWPQLFPSSAPPPSSSSTPTTNPTLDTSLHIDGLFALHACDTASCEALATGVSLDTDLMAVAPCCQAELAKAWSQMGDSQPKQPKAFAPIWRSPHLRREAGATMTDVLRTLLVRGCGYTVTPMEFVPSAHTPKNTLLRATKNPAETPVDTTSFQEYLRLRETLGGVSIHLEKILPLPHKRHLNHIEHNRH